VQVQPGGGSFVGKFVGVLHGFEDALLTHSGGGLWQPDAQQLSTLRREIDRKPHKIKRVLADEGIRRTFLGGVGEGDTKVVKAFVSLPTNQSNALKRNPKVSRISFCVVAMEDLDLQRSMMHRRYPDSPDCVSSPQHIS
jgi:hypothetical protein